MVTTIGVAAITLLVFRAFAPAPFPNPVPKEILPVRAIDQRIQEMRFEFNVQIFYRFDPALFFPPKWRNRPYFGKGKQISESDLDRAVAVCKQFLSEHPKPVIQKNLTHIFLLGDLEFNGLQYGGTYIQSAIYVMSDGLAKGYTVDFLRSMCHAEFSSILFRNYPFPSDEWSQLNPKDFRYGNSGAEFLRQDNVRGTSDELQSNGFLIKYSQSTLEDDFNVMTEWLFAKPAELESVAERFEVIRKKREIAIRFYQSIDPNYHF